MTRQEKIDLLMKPVLSSYNFQINSSSSKYTKKEMDDMRDYYQDKYESMSDVQLTNIVMINF